MTQSASEYFEQLAQLLTRAQVTDDQGVPIDLDEAIHKGVAWVRSVQGASKKIMAIGNGGSSSIASHMHNDLSKGVGVKTLVFHETPLLTALSNDESYASVFERPIELWAQAGDLLFAISSSGKSENILRGVRTARVLGCRVVTLSGFEEANPLRSLGHINFYVPSKIYGFVESAHSVLSHYLTDRVMAEARRAPVSGELPVVSAP